MDEEQNESVEPEGSVETETEEKPWSISQEDWNQLQEQNRVVVGALRELYSRNDQPQQPQQEEDESDLDFYDHMQRYVDQRFGEITPQLEAQAIQTGKQELQTIFGELKKTVGDFDEARAERFAHSYFQETGVDPRSPQAQQAAQWAAAQGAKEAAEYRKAERQAGIEEYKASLQRDPFSDGPAAAGGERAAKAFQSMDDVIAHYSGEEQV